MTDRPHKKVLKLAESSLFLALALVLPLLTAQVQQLGNSLCLIHIPVFLCGFICGPWYAMAVGFVAPLLRFLIFGMPPLIPSGVSMCIEMAVYGLTSGLLYSMLPKKPINIYISLVCAMLSGRACWGLVRWFLFSIGKTEFGWTAFFAGAFTTAIPGIVIQLVLIPLLIMALNKNKKGE